MHNKSWQLHMQECWFRLSGNFQRNFYQFGITLLVYNNITFFSIKSSIYTINSIPYVKDESQIFAIGVFQPTGDCIKKVQNLLVK